MGQGSQGLMVDCMLTISLTALVRYASTCRIVDSPSDSSPKPRELGRVAWTHVCQRVGTTLTRDPAQARQLYGKLTALTEPGRAQGCGAMVSRSVLIRRTPCRERNTNTPDQIWTPPCSDAGASRHRFEYSLDGHGPDHTE